MIRRLGGYLATLKPEMASPAARELEVEGCTVVRNALTQDEVAQLHDAVTGVFDDWEPDNRNGTGRERNRMFRYEMLNRNKVCRASIAHPAILSVIEPLLGDNCHVIANTAWRNPPKPNDPAQGWHIDAGPHIPLSEDTEWPEHIPHPVFAIGVHVFLQDCTEDDGPTGVIPGSHLSGRFPPQDRAMDPELTWRDRGVRKMTAKAGDISFFVSDAWHRRLPTGPNDQGRFFLQVHYGRRDIQQRIKSSAELNQLSTEAQNEQDPRVRTAMGLHPNGFYDG
tara:strand:+ start:3422 stop:4261 length:840 start_codon:yes stop_codon:yes gene_type:complete